MRRKGSRFTLGVWGLSCVCRTLRLCSQPFATVRNRSREVAMAVPMVSSAKGITFGGSQRRVASCHVAGVASCDIPTCLIACPKSFLCGRCHVLRRCVAFFGASAALSRPPMSFCMAGAALWKCLVAFLPIAFFRAASSAVVTLNTQQSTLYTPHLHSTHTLYNLHSTLHTPHFTLYTPHSTLCTSHFRLYTLHFKLHTFHFTLPTPHFTLYTLHFTLYTPQSTLYTLHSTLHTLHSTLHTLHLTLHTTLYTPHFTLYT